MENLDLSIIVSVNIKWYSHSWKQIYHTWKHLPYKAAISFMSSNPWVMKTFVHAKIYTQIFIATWFIIIKKGKQLKCPLVHEQLNKLSYPYHGIQFSNKRGWNIDKCKHLERQCRLHSILKIKAFSQWCWRRKHITDCHIYEFVFAEWLKL